MVLTAEPALSSYESCKSCKSCLLNPISPPPPYSPQQFNITNDLKEEYEKALPSSVCYRGDFRCEFRSQRPDDERKSDGGRRRHVSDQDDCGERHELGRSHDSGGGR